MKKTFVMMALMSSFLLGNASKSEAGIILLPSPIGGSLLMTGFLLTLGGGMNLANGGVSRGNGLIFSYTVLGLGVTLIMMDADGSLNHERLASDLSRTYKITENTEFYSQVASLIRAEAESVPFANGKKMVRISREKVGSLLTMIDTSGNESEVERLLADLE